MKVIILRAGEGSRLRPITDTIPKPMINIFGKTILEHNIDSIYNLVDEIIIVVKYKKEIIIDFFKDNYKGTKISYIEQGDEKGTAAAIRGIDIGQNDVVIMNGDSIFSPEDLYNLFTFDGYGALVQKVEDPSKYGIFGVDHNGFAISIVEKPQEFIGDLANVGVYKFSYEIIDISNNISISPRGEYEITDSIKEFISKNKFKLIQTTSPFIDVGYPWDILSANSIFLNKLVFDEINGEIEQNVNIKGNIVLGKNSIIKSGTYIEGNVFIGENCTIGPNAYIRGNTTILNNSKVGNRCEIKNSYIGNNTNISHLSYIGDSVIGNNVNIAGGFIRANLRHDNQNIKVKIKEELIDTKLRKFGCIIGDGVKTGINTQTMPGRIIKTGVFTNPGELIK